MKLNFIRSSPFGIISLLIPFVIIAVSMFALSIRFPGAEDPSNDLHLVSNMEKEAGFYCVALFAFCGGMVGFVLSVVGIVRRLERYVFAVPGLVLNLEILFVASMVLFRNFRF